jgi:CheY-like chemotaxis protein/anti-sigma regulatory factor (Ser/Thr protein kinase)
VLDLARVESGRFDVASEPVAVAPLVHDCGGLMRPLAQAAAVRLDLPEIDADLYVQADRTRLKQVLLDLLSNAVKYNRREGQVEIEVEVDCELLGDRVCVRVRDTGPGLDEQQQDRLFVPFERLAAGSSQVEGTGIGLALALARCLVELMHGQIGVHGSPGAGSTFRVALPVAGAAAPASVVAGPVGRQAVPVEPAGADDSRGPVTVLSIEDDASNQHLLDGILAARPAATLLHAGRPVNGLALARRHRPALILLDIHLPDMDGYEVLRLLRADPAIRGTPVLALSANARPDDVARGRHAGFDDYLTKPLDVAQLFDHIDRALAR